MVLQNIKLVVLMRASGYSDREISERLGIGVGQFLREIEGDEYLRECYERASEKVINEVEAKFLENVLEKLEAGDTVDAKWLLERVSKKYQKRDIVDVNVKSIDEIIVERGLKGEK